MKITIYKLTYILPIIGLFLCILGLNMRGAISSYDMLSYLIAIIINATLMIIIYNQNTRGQLFDQSNNKLWPVDGVNP